MSVNQATKTIHHHYYYYHHHSAIKRLSKSKVLPLNIYTILCIRIAECCLVWITKEDTMIQFDIIIFYFLLFFIIFIFLFLTCYTSESTIFYDDCFICSLEIRLKKELPITNLKRNLQLSTCFWSTLRPILFLLTFPIPVII